MTGSEFLIIGAGKLGTSLYRALSKFRQTKVSLYGKKSFNISSTKFLNRKNYFFNLSQAVSKEVDVIFICVQDQKIKKTIATLNKFDLQNKIIFHTSGATGLDVFSDLKEQNVFTGAFHPVQTFSCLFGEPGIWKNIYCSFEGDVEAEKKAREICKKLACKLLVLNAQQKLALHIAAVYTSNFVIPLLYEAEKIITESQINIKPSKLIQPLLAGLSRNYKSAFAKDILSGPVKRGDLEIVKNHLNYLKEEKHNIHLYKQLANEIIKNPDFKIENTKSIKKILGDYGTN